MWVLDLQAEIESDFSVFHRIDDPLTLPASRYFRLAERLPMYAGAVQRRFQVALLEEQERANPTPVEPDGHVWVDELTVSSTPTYSGHVLEAIQPDPRLPGIEYTDGS